MSTGDPDPRDTMIISMPHATDAEMAGERERLLEQVHPGTAVVVTRGICQHAELTALAVRAFTLLDDSLRSTARPREAAGWDRERARWLLRYHAYLEEIHGA